jgi:hypothetical protein
VISASFVAPPGHELPAGIDTLPVAIGNSGLQPTGARVFATTQDLAAAKLWPYPSGYEVWGGGCQDGSPTITGISNLVTVYPVSPGVPAARTVTLGALDVYAAADAHVSAIHLPDPDTAGDPVTPDPLCPTGLSVDLGDADGTGLLKTSLPYGAWKIVSGTDGVVVVVGQVVAVAVVVAPPAEPSAPASPTDAPTGVVPLPGATP